MKPSQRLKNMNFKCQMKSHPHFITFIWPSQVIFYEFQQFFALKSQRVLVGTPNWVLLQVTWHCFLLIYSRVLWGTIESLNQSLDCIFNIIDPKSILATLIFVHFLYLITKQNCWTNHIHLKVCAFCILFCICKYYTNGW